MGRKKIQISRIQDERNRQITFSKRKAGLLKKAYELSVLCDVEVAVIMISSNSKLYQYASSNMNSILIRYTEFKDPDESKTNADILEDITRKEKGGHGGDEDGGGDEDDDTRQYMAGTEHGGPTAYHRLSEEFEMMDRTTTIQPTHVPAQPPSVLISPRVPQAMPVSIPVPSSSSPRVAQRVLGSAGSTGSSSTGTPFSPDTTSSPASAGSGSMMPPPTGTPTRLQTIRNQTLKLHLPGSGRHYISLGSGGSEKKSPAPSDDSGGRAGDSSSDGAAASSSRPQLRVVLPGQKGFVYRSAPSSPPPMVGLDNTVAVSSSASVPTATGVTTNTSTTSVNPVSSSMESLTTPVVSLSTPNILSNLSPLLSSLTSELPLGSAGGGDSAASALVAFPVSIQPTPGTSKGQASGSNIVLQAQNMGQPFLLAPSNYENKQQLPGTFPFTPSSNPSLGLSPPLIRDLEQLKHQYDRIYQQISQTLHHHQLHQQHSQKDKADEEDPPSTVGGKESGTATTSEPADGEQESAAKRPRIDSAAATT